MDLKFISCCEKCILLAGFKGTIVSMESCGKIVHEELDFRVIFFLLVWCSVNLRGYAEIFMHFSWHKWKVKSEAPSWISISAGITHCFLLCGVTQISPKVIFVNLELRLNS